MAEPEEHVLTADEIRAQIAEAKRKKDEAKLAPKTTRTRRAAEQKQRKARVNSELLREHGALRDKTWTIRASEDQISAVKNLAAQLSKRGPKVSIAELMEEAIELLLAKHRGEQ